MQPMRRYTIEARGWLPERRDVTTLARWDPAPSRQSRRETGRDKMAVRRVPSLVSRPQPQKSVHGRAVMATFWQQPLTDDDSSH